MNSLLNISGYVRRAMIASILVSLLSLAAAGQNIDPRQEGRMYGDPGFVGEPINLNVVNADIRDILNYITEQYGINFVIDKSVGAIPVTVNVNDVPWNVALDSILRSQQLGIQVNGNILRVADSKSLATEQEILNTVRESQLDTSPLYTEFIRLNYARAVGNIGRGAPTSGTTSGSGGGAGAGGGGGAGAGNEGLLPIVKRRLSRRGSVEVDLRSNSLIITDVRQNIDAIRQLVSILDQPEPQVEIEARIVVATRNFSRDVGVQLSGLVVGANGSGAAGSTLPGSASGIGIPRGLPVGTINNGLASQIANTAIGLTTGVFGTAQINLLITAGEQKGQAKVIATPRVTALNNRQAVIESKTQIPITTVQPGAAAGGAVVATTEYVDVPLKLQITPQITDLGTVVLDVVAENSSTATIVGGAAPAINTQMMQTQVTVPDGGTTVIGGVLFDDERENQDRTPGLSRIPILGNLFKRKGVQRNTNEILFFITPRIYRPDFAAAAGSSGTRPAATIIQPVPLGNPTSNSGQQAEEPVTTAPVMQLVQPAVTPDTPKQP